MCLSFFSSDRVRVKETRDKNMEAKKEKRHHSSLKSESWVAIRAAVVNLFSIPGIMVAARPRSPRSKRSRRSSFPLSPFFVVHRLLPSIKLLDEEVDVRNELNGGRRASGNFVSSSSRYNKPLSTRAMRFALT